MTDDTQQEFTDADVEAAREAEEEQQMILDDLKNRATQLGIKFHSSIGVDKLREKIQAALNNEEVAESAEEKEAVAKDNQTEAERRAAKKKDSMKLVRVRITCMDPMKKNHQGDFFLTGNALVGTVKRYVPFGVEWHVPQITLNMIQEKKFQQFSTSKNAEGREVVKARLVKTYAVEVLQPLTKKELKDLAQRQAMAKGAETE